MIIMIYKEFKESHYEPYEHNIERILFMGFICIVIMMLASIPNKPFLRISTIDTQTYSLLSYDEHKSLSKDNEVDDINILYKTSNGLFEIEPDNKTEIINETAIPTKVTIERAQCFNLVWLLPETHYTYTFS